MLRNKRKKIKEKENNPAFNKKVTFIHEIKCVISISM